jgi:F-type H+-transporting ATPase subunit b
MTLDKSLALRGVFARALLVVVLAGGGVSVHAQAYSSDHVKSSPAAVVPEKKEEVKDENEEYRHSATVQKLGGMLGMKPEAAATAFTVLNFLVLVAGVGYMLLKMLPKAFRNRSSAIQKDLVSARTATEEASARLGSVEARLAKLDDQIAAMRTEAEAASKRDELRIKASVEDEKARIVAAAEAEILSATTLARREIQSYAAGLAIEHAAKRLQVTAETDRLLIENFANKLGDTYGSEN